MTILEVNHSHAILEYKGLKASTLLSPLSLSKGQVLKCASIVTRLTPPQTQKRLWKPGPGHCPGVILVVADPQRMLRKAEKTAKAKVSSLLGPKHPRPTSYRSLSMQLVTMLPHQSQTSRRYVRQVYMSLYSMCS